MPTPVDIFTAPTTLISLGIWLCLLTIETVAPATKLPKLKLWRTRGLVMLLVYILLSSYLPLFTDEFLASHRLFDLTHLPVWAGVAIAILCFEAALYAWHRSMHSNAKLWRVFHQMHHSPERMDIAGAFYFSPMDMIGFTLLGSFSMVFVIGVSPQATTIAMISLFFFSTFQHANIRTPRWLGYFVQRPESHSVHHARDVHMFNYSDLPVFDMLFGTFRNPENFSEAVGFYDGASARVWDLLRFKDISRKTEGSD